MREFPVLLTTHRERSGDLFQPPLSAPRCTVKTWYNRKLQRFTRIIGCQSRPADRGVCDDRVEWFATGIF